MLRLRTFGGLWLEGPEGAAQQTATRRRLALLALLAASGRQGVSRDRVLALLWSESDEERGRHALAQTVYALRRDLGREDAVTGTADIRLDPTVISADVLDFDEALAAGRLEAAASLYAGPFLDSFHLNDAPEFARWADERRADYAQRAGRTFETLARRATDAGEHAQAVDWWRKAAALDPHSARVARELMTALAAAGDRAGALAYARLYATRFREEIGAEPDGSVAALARNLPEIASPPAAPHAPPAAAPAEGDAGASRRPAPVVSAPGGPTRRRRAPYLAGVGALLVLIVVVTTTALLRRASLPFDERDWIVLADLENHTGDTLLDRSLVTAAAAALGQSRHVNVFPANRVRETLQRMRDTATTLDEARAREVAVREGLRGVLVLGVGRVDDAYTLTARFVDPASGAALASWNARPAGRETLLDQLDELLRRVRRALGEAGGAVARSQPLPAVTTGSLEALRHFADGTRAWYEGRWREALTSWQAAVRLDSMFVRAHQALGSAYYWLDNRPEGDAHFARALALLDRLPERERLWVEAQVAGSRGDNATETDRWRVYLERFPDDRDAWYNLATSLKQASRCADAVAPFERVLALDPAMTRALINLALCQEELGQTREALATFDRAFALAPEERTRTAGDINRLYGFLNLKAGDSAAARATFAALLDREPLQRANGHRSLALLEMYFGRYARATEHLEEAVLLTRAARAGLSEYRNRLYLVAAHAARGRDAAARRELAASAELEARLKPPPAWSGFLLRQYARAGRLAEAGHLLQAIESRVNPESPSDRSGLESPRGEIALAEGRYAEALDALELAYRLTPEAYHLEPLARALHLAGDYGRATTRYLELLDRMPLGWEPQEAWVLARYQLGRISEELRDTAAAVDHYRKFIRQWAEGDPDLVVLRDARQRLAALVPDAGR